MEEPIRALMRAAEILDDAAPELVRVLTTARLGTAAAS
jgi:hypothetical protein